MSQGWLIWHSITCTLKRKQNLKKWDITELHYATLQSTENNNRWCDFKKKRMYAEGMDTMAGNLNMLQLTKKNKLTASTKKGGAQGHIVHS